MKTLYISDMDGTLLDSDSQVSPTTAAILSELSGQGALVTVATARTPATVMPLLSATGLKVPAVVMTGAALWHWDSATYSNVRFLPVSVCASIDGVCAANDLHPFVYTLGDDAILDVYHSSQSLSAAETTFYKERSDLPLKRFHLGHKVPDGKQAILYYTLGPAEAVIRAAGQLQCNPEISVSCYLDIFDRSIAHLEIFHAGVSKADAVSTLKEMLGADRVVAFGDNLNDLPMLEAADLAVAVGNAFDAVKNAADIVIGDNGSDSVARYILDDFTTVR